MYKETTGFVLSNSNFRHLSTCTSYLLTSCDHGRDENQQVFSRGFSSPLCSSNWICLHRYPSQVFPDSWVAFFLFPDVGETRGEGQIWFPFSQVDSDMRAAISSHPNDIWGLWEVFINLFHCKILFPVDVLYSH